MSVLINVPSSWSVLSVVGGDLVGRNKPVPEKRHRGHWRGSEGQQTHPVSGWGQIPVSQFQGVFLSSFYAHISSA